MSDTKPNAIRLVTLAVSGADKAMTNDPAAMARLHADAVAAVRAAWSQSGPALDLLALADLSALTAGDVLARFTAQADALKAAAPVLKPETLRPARRTPWLDRSEAEGWLDR